MATRRAAESILRKTFATYGYGEVQTPAFEELELFTAKSGDGIISELYDFIDKGDRRMTLRPELTAPTMRMYFQDHAFDPKPVKWFYHGPCYRYDRPQEGRYREFWQFGCEQIGAGTPLAYAELIALAGRCFAALGLEGVEVRVGHVAILRACVEAFGFDDETRGAMMRAIDKEDRNGMSELVGATADAQAAHERLLGVMDAATLDEAVAAFGAPLEAFDELAAVLSHLEGLGQPVRLNLGIARGLDYYTGVVFEAHCQELEAQSQLLGGGGYDLSHVFGGQPTPTMGFGLGFDRALVALEKQGKSLAANTGVDVYLGALGSAQSTVTGLATELRQAGAKVDMDLMGRKPNAIAKAANASGARFLVMLGDRDLESGDAVVKALETGTDQPVPVSGLATWLLEQLGADLQGYD